MADENKTINTDWLMRGVMAGFGVLVVALLGWMGMNIARIPTIEQDISYMQKDIAGIHNGLDATGSSDRGRDDRQSATNMDHEIRLRALEAKRPNSR